MEREENQPSSSTKRPLPVCPSLRWLLEILGSRWSPWEKSKERVSGSGHCQGQLCPCTPGTCWPGITLSERPLPSTAPSASCIKPSFSKNKPKDRPEMTSETASHPKITATEAMPHSESLRRLKSWLCRVPGEQAALVWELLSHYISHRNLTPGLFLCDVSAWRAAAAALETGIRKEMEKHPSQRENANSNITHHHHSQQTTSCR